MEAMADLDFVTPNEAAKKLRLNPATLKRWRLRGEGPKARVLSPKHVVYAVKDIREFLERCAIGGVVDVEG
jgi:hypothetical protein